MVIPVMMDFDSKGQSTKKTLSHVFAVQQAIGDIPPKLALLETLQPSLCRLDVERVSGRVKCMDEL